MLEWIFNRVTDKAEAVETPIGAVPTPDAIDTAGLDLSRAQMDELLRVDTEGWRAEVPLIEQYYAQFGDRLPQALADQPRHSASDWAEAWARGARAHPGASPTTADLSIIPTHRARGAWAARRPVTYDSPPSAASTAMVASPCGRVNTMIRGMSEPTTQTSCWRMPNRAKARPWADRGM